MTTKTDTEIKVYFYNGFDKPKLLSNNLEGLKDVEISDNYLGDMTEEFHEEIDNLPSVDITDIEVMNDINEVLGDFNMIANPSLADLVELSKYWFENDVPTHHFEDFGTPQEVRNIANRVYDDFKKYEGYENKYIIENYIRFTDIDTVYEVYKDLSEIESTMDEHDLWGEYIIFGVDNHGRAYVPEF
ncbi:hypothetical protein [Enterococcus mundtii]|uniref:hypothetical protein n=1 Tax=Enterococcus mundtii TaxID=53346 RepID=UPI001A979081|nr:hypothetical protein [Enterococcus mundtii]MBO1087136.1 hypothetical protein [Enterococcus mundtii]